MPECVQYTRVQSMEEAFGRALSWHQRGVWENTAFTMG